MNNLNFLDREIERVDIVFENCEVYEVPADCIYRMTVDNIKFQTVLHFNGLSEFTKPGETSNFTSCEYASIIINKKGMNLKSSWNEMYSDDEDDSLKERVKHNDITHFDLIYKDGAHLYVSVPWENGNSEFDNKYQHNDIRDDIIFIDICDNYNEKQEKESNDECYSMYKYEMYEEKYRSNVPEYVQAAFALIDEELSRVMWNINQEEFDSPFSNTGEQFKNDVFEVEAYSWDNEYDQKYNFKWKDYKVRWYKHCKRDPQANREISADECATMLNECLESIRSMDIDEDDLFTSQEKKHYCLHCGEPTEFKELQNGKWACEKCLNDLGKEQIALKEEIENTLYEFGFDKEEDITNCIDTFIDIVKYAKNNTTIETLDHLIKGLGAVSISLKYENGLLDEETKRKIDEETAKYKKSIDK